MGYIQTVTIISIIALNLVFKPVLSASKTPSTGKAPSLKVDDEPLKKIKVNEGSKLRLRCKGRGDPKQFITWYKDGEKITRKDIRRLKVKPNYLLIVKPRVEDSGVYACHRQNIHGEVWKNYTLTVKTETKNEEPNVVDCKTPGPPQFRDKSQLNKWIARPSHATAEFKCMVCGNPKPKVTWFAKGQGINASISGKYKVRRKTLLVVDAVSKKDEGLYMCVVENEHGSVNHTYELKVIDQMLTKPVIQGPLNQTVTYLDDAKFQCKVVMSDLQSHIQWLKHYQVNGSFTNEDEDPYVHVIQQSFFNLTDPEILYIRNVTYEDAGWYTCLVTNSMGRAYQSAWLTVEACKPGSYGKECKKVCGHCESNEPCNHINGSCPGSCEPGYKGEMCLATCNGGWYGRECKQRCGYCRDDEPCHHVTGSCSGFCEPGYLGDKCDESEFSQLLVIQRKMLSSVREILSFKRRKAGLIANGTFPADLK